MTASHRIITTCAILLWVAIPTMQAQEPLSLERCRQMAIANNKGMKQADEQRAEAEARQKMALWQMLPKVSANGLFLYTDRDIRLIGEEQEQALGTMGDRIESDLVGRLADEGLLGSAAGNIVQNMIENSGLNTTVNEAGQRIADALNPGIHSVTGGAITITQPIFMGGKLLAAYRTARLMNHMSGLQYDQQQEQLLIGVDEAYWQVVSVHHKLQLAEQYAELLRTLNDNVEQMVEAEVATKGDLAKVRVKLNEAEMSLAKATNGLVLAKMLLAQRCGMPLDTIYEIELPTALELAPLTPDSNGRDMQQVLANRHEMQLLAIADSVAQQGVVIARSTLLPNIALTGGYMVSNPNLFDGVEKEWGGTAMVGVVVNVPLLHPGGFYALKAAKHRRNQIAYQRQEAEEMIGLQVNKLSFELEVAEKKLAQARANMENAEENLLLAEESFKAGMIGSSDLMAAQTAWVSAQGEVLDAEIEIAMDRVYLRQALGQSQK